jgi:RNA polymerase sigma factor (sigma-70 family)
LPEPIQYTEDKLIALLKQKDKQAFSYLYDHYSAALNGVILRYIEDREQAEDILQEVFVKIWNNFDSYEPLKGRLFTWMINIARNLSIDTLRSKSFKNQQKISSDENSVNTIKDERAGLSQFDTIGLRKQLELLKPEQKRIIDMAYFDGFTQEEISNETGLPLGTVKTRMRTAILELRKILLYN